MRTVGFAFSPSALDFLTTLPPKLRRQVIKKSRALHTAPFPQGCKKLQDIETSEGEAVWRERSGDYRILYVVRDNPAEIIIMHIDHRKDVYKMPKTVVPTDQDMRMSEADFDNLMRSALGVDSPKEPLQTGDEGPQKRKATGTGTRKKGKAP